jgi:hypothetical protein
MAAVSAIKPAIKAVIYRNTASSTPYASPTWTALTLVRDVNAARPWDFGDASIRATRVKLYHPTQMDFAFSMTMRCDDLDTGYLAIDAAAVSGAVLDLLILDGALTVEGSRGVRAHFHVSDTGQDQAIGNILYKTYELKAGFSSDGVPKAISVGASSAITATDPG